MGKSEDDFYRVYYKSSTISFSEVCRDLDEVHKFLEAREDKLFGVEIRVKQQGGWKEIELAELARLKAKYEPKEGDK